MTWIKRIGIALIIIIILALIGLRVFMYKTQHGFASYETAPHDITIPADRPTILLFSKTTAFRHNAAINASKSSIDSLGESEDWYIYKTEDAGIFNADQLSQFDLVIWNNSTGPVLNEGQRALFQSYIEDGGGYLGIHGSGDFSHNWDWYKNEIICADFSHHPIKNHIQNTTVYLTDRADSSWQVPPVWAHSDEWYIFLNNPEDKGAQLLYMIDGESIDPNGDLFWMKGKDFGMGKVHPVAWHKQVGSGRVFYTSMGHTADTFTNKNFMSMLRDGIIWAGQL